MVVLHSCMLAVYTDNFLLVRTDNLSPFLKQGSKNFPKILLSFSVRNRIYVDITIACSVFEF